MTLSFAFYVLFFFFKQKTAYEMRISDWSSDVCSSDLRRGQAERPTVNRGDARRVEEIVDERRIAIYDMARGRRLADAPARVGIDINGAVGNGARQPRRVVEHRNDQVAPFAEGRVAVLQELLRAAQRRDGGGLRNRAGVGRRLRLELAHRLDEPGRAAGLTDAPAGHRIGLGTAVHRQDAVDQVGRSEE